MEKKKNVGSYRHIGVAIEETGKLEGAKIGEIIR